MILVLFLKQANLTFNLETKPLKLMKRSRNKDQNCQKTRMEKIMPLFFIVLAIKKKYENDLNICILLFNLMLIIKF